MKDFCEESVQNMWQSSWHLVHAPRMSITFSILFLFLSVEGGTVSICLAPHSYSSLCACPLEPCFVLHLLGTNLTDSAGGPLAQQSLQHLSIQTYICHNDPHITCVIILTLLLDWKLPEVGTTFYWINNYLLRGLNICALNQEAIVCQAPCPGIGEGR